MSERTNSCWLVGLVAVAVVVGISTAARGPIAANAPALATEMTYKPLGVDNPELQREKLDNSRKTQYKSTGRDLFSEIAPPPPVDPRRSQSTPDRLSLPFRRRLLRQLCRPR